MKSTLAKITSDLVRFQSVDELKGVMSYVEKRLRKLKGCFLERLSDGGKPVLVVTFAPRHKRPTIFLHGHLDVVPAEPHQFNPKLEGNRLYGRGAQDMKGGCAVMIALIEHFASQSQKPDVGFMFVGDEETSGLSAKQLLKKGYCPKLFITLEPTDLDFVIETKGIIWMNGVIKGMAAHASMPWLGKNPITFFHESLKKLYAVFPLLQSEQWKTAVSVNAVQSGDFVNRIPPELSFKIDIRYLPKDSPQKTIQKVKKCFPPSTKWQIVKCDPPHQKACDMRLIKKLKNAAEALRISPIYKKAPFATDARFFSAAGIPSVVFGPQGSGMHGEREWVDLKSLEKLFEILKHFLSAL